MASSTEPRHDGNRAHHAEFKEAGSRREPNVQHEIVLSTNQAVGTFEAEEWSIEVSASLDEGDLNTQVVGVAAAYAVG
jgi:hypothetical protein